MRGGLAVGADAERVASEGYKLREGGGDGGGHGGGQGGGAAHGAGGVQAEPRIDARRMEHVAALGEHAEHVAILVIAQADGAERVLEVRERLRGRVHHLGIRLYRDLVQAARGPISERTRYAAVVRAPRVVRRHRRGVSPALAAAAGLVDAHTHVRRQHDGGHQHQDAHRYGDAVP